MQDPRVAVRLALGLAELDASEATWMRMRAYQDAHPWGRFGRIAHCSESVGLAPTELRTRAREDMETFGISQEAN